MELFYLIYKSVPVENITEKDLLEIAETSKINNLDNDLTGLLLYGNNTFVQVLEGGEYALEILYQKLLVDKRHSQVTVIKRGKLENRYFPIWSMNFRSVGIAEMKLIVKVIEGEQTTPVASNIALEMVAGFMKRNG